MTWDPHAYPAIIRSEIHDYEKLQERVAQATVGISARDILDLGIGTGETAARVLRLHPGARLVGIDSSAAMLRGATQVLPRERVTLIEQDLQSPLPDKRFDLVVSSLAIHHLKGDGKASLFGDIANHLHPGGLFVMGDVIVPEDPSDALIENEPGYDFPSTIDDQLGWMSDAGLSPTALWVRKDLAVLSAEATIG